MRYALTIVLALGIGVTGALPAALAGDITPGPNSTFTNQYGNQVVPVTPGAGGGTVCYMDGVAYSCIQPARVAFPDSSTGTVAGPTTPGQPSPFYGGDRN
jgi:hypothetical protein